MRQWLVRLALGACAFTFMAAPAAAQSESATLVGQLTALLGRAGLDAVAAPMPGTDDQFVAALYYPGQQLLVVSGRYPVPALLKEKILLKRYKDAYIDLFTASAPQTRRLVEDLRADGLKAIRTGKDPFDSFTRQNGTALQFDGNWKKRKVSEEQYMQDFQHADQAYAAMLQALIAQLAPAAGAPGGTSQPAAATPSM